MWLQLYPLCLGVAIGCSYYYARPKVQLNTYRLFFLLNMICAWLGAKFMFLITFPTGGNYIDVPMFWLTGGLVFYGGLISAFLISSLLYSQSDQIQKLVDQNLKKLLASIFLAQFIGRIGCWFAGCCYGAHLHGSWAKVFGDRIPVQLIHALLLLVAFQVFKRMIQKNLIVSFLIIHSSIRLGVEYLRDDIERGSWFSLTPSTWICSIIVVIGGAYLTTIKRSDQIR